MIRNDFDKTNLILIKLFFYFVFFQNELDLQIRCIKCQILVEDDIVEKCRHCKQVKFKFHVILKVSRG